MSRKSGKGKSTWLGTSQFRWIVIIQMKQFLDLSFSDLSLSLYTLHRFLWKDWCSSTCYDVAQFTLQIKTRSERLERLERLVSEDPDCLWPGIIFKCLGVAMTSCLGFVRVRWSQTIFMGACNQRWSFVGSFRHISWGYRDGSKPLLLPCDWVNLKKSINQLFQGTIRAHPGTISFPNSHLTCDMIWRGREGETVKPHLVDRYFGWYSHIDQLTPFAHHTWSSQSFIRFIPICFMVFNNPTNTMFHGFQHWNNAWNCTTVSLIPTAIRRRGWASWPERSVTRTRWRDPRGDPQTTELLKMYPLVD